MARFKFIKMVLILGILFLFSYLLASNFNSIDFSDKIAVIPVKGEISSNGETGLLNDNFANSDDIVNYLKLANNDKTIKAIILEINSPGGTALASKQIADAVKNLNKPSVALIQSVGASGAYWVASSTDAIVADPLSITGSIGVIGSYLEFEGLMNKYGVKYERLVTGKFKDLGSPYKSLTPEETKILQNKINLIHNVFVQEVNKNRKKDLSKYATGEFFLGMEAQDIGLIDHLGNKDTAINISKKLANISQATLVSFSAKKSIFGSLDKYFSKYSYYIGLGISEGAMYSKNDFTINA